MQERERRDQQCVRERGKTHDVREETGETINASDRERGKTNDT